MQFQRLRIVLLVGCVMFGCSAMAQHDGAATHEAPDTVELHNEPVRSSVAMHGFYEAGSFRRPFDAESEWRSGVSTLGVKRLLSWTFHGAFDYSYNRQAAVWRAGVAEPYRNTPFIWADTSRGNWTHHQVRTGLQVASPFKNGRAFGLAIGYIAGQGARDTRPKPLYRVNRIEASPFINFSGDRLKVQGGVQYEYRREEDEMGGAYTSGNVLLYRLRGYGTFDKTSFISGVRFYNAHRGALYSTVRRNGGTRTNLILSARFSIMKEGVVEGIAEPTSVGTYREMTGDLCVRLTGVEKNSYTSVLLYSYVSGEGLDPAFNAVNAGKTIGTARATLSRKFDYSLRSVSMGLFHQSQKGFDIVTTTDWSVQRIGVDAGASVVVAGWTFVPALTYSKVYNHLLTIGRPTEVSTSIVVPYLDYLATTFVSARTEVSKDIALRDGSFIRCAVNVSVSIADGRDFLSYTRFSVVPQLTLFMK